VALSSRTKTDLKLAAFRTALVALALSCPAAWGQQTASAATAQAAAERCHAPRASVDACDDAIRWNSRDASLLVAMGDAQTRAKRYADAARAYRHAATLVPGTPGIQQKISDAEALLAKSKSSSGRSAVTASAVKHFSNADPESQSH
jgi:cytochrome c-type biogenesis protein CcmH/NrfG